MQTYVGVDFGTTNSAVAIVDEQEELRVASFPMFGKSVQTFRSLLYFSFEKRDKEGYSKVSAGPEAIERYLEEDGMGRLILSPKTSLASRTFDYTTILGKRYYLEDLVSIILNKLRFRSEEQLGELGKRAVVGRPVRYAYQKTEADEEKALHRMRLALERSGFEDVVFEFEPIAAAYAYESRLTQDERVLVADFGGGTADFCIIDLGPNVRKRGRKDSDILGTAGVAIAGDVFDSRVVHEFFSPHLGLGSEYRSEFDRILSVPIWPYKKLRQWYTVTLLQEPKTVNMLMDLERRSFEPEKIEAFLDFIHGNLGFHLYHAVEGCKVELSSKEESHFIFKELPKRIEGTLVREQFEQWIQGDLEEIAKCCDGLFEKVGIPFDEIDRVFMTGGTSFVPAVRDIFAQRFGEEKIGSGNELTSVASGLALRAKDLFG